MRMKQPHLVPQSIFHRFDLLQPLPLSLSASVVSVSFRKYLGFGDIGGKWKRWDSASVEISLRLGIVLQMVKDELG
jgi:hypothetical protein